MRIKILSFIYLLIPLIVTSFQLKSQTWTQLTSGTTNHLQGVSAPSGLVCFAVGYNGTILKTSNGGTSWIPQTSGTTAHLASVKFTDVNTGYAVGDNGVALKTTNGGTNWSLMSLGTTNPLRNVHFISADTGYITGGASGSYGSIYKTTNAGLSWTSLSITAPNLIYSCYFTSALVGYASEYSGLMFKTTDGGTSWNSVSAGVSNTPGMVVFTNPTDGVLVTFTGAIRRTTDAGATWSAVTSGTTDVLQGIDFYDANNGLTVGGNSAANTATMLSTADGGATWTAVTLNSGISRLCRIDLVDQNTGYVVGLDGTILKYSTCPNAGWVQLTSGTTNHLQGVSAPTSSVCYATGYNGTILKTSNGGASWIPQTSGTTAHLASIKFTDVNTGYAVGDNGVALRTTNGGTNWSAMPLGTTNSLRNVHFINADTGYITGGASGSYGSIFKTTNAGLTWTSLSITTPNLIYSCYFTSDLIGYASEYSGLMYKTTDGGTSWNSVSSGVSNTPGMVVFTNTTDGVLVTFSGAIRRTTDAGATWPGVTSGTTDVLQGVDFYNPNNGFTVGGNSGANTATMLSTADGGATWTNVTLNTGISRLCRIDLVDQNTGYVVGLDGTILKYSNCINDTSNLQVVISHNNTSGFGVCDGTATASVIGNGSGYSYLWTSGQTTSSISGLCADTYVVTVTDSLGVMDTATVVILEPADTICHTGWTHLTSGTTYHLQGVSAPSTLVCYAVGYNGTILKTSNGGTSWLPQTSGTTAHLASVKFTDVNTGYAVGDNGAAIKTTNGGINWLMMSLGTTNALRNVHFISADTGYITGGASGSYGSIYKTTDAGLTWTSLSITALNLIYSCYFTSNLVGYASEYSGLMYKTTDGGTSWNSVSSGVSNTPGMVVFTNPTDGVLVTFTGAIQRTIDAGATWSGVTSGTTNVLQGIDFYDANNGIAVGGNISANTATMLSTADGGATWTPVSLNSGILRLSRIDLVDQNTGYVVGLDGTILKYSTCTNDTSNLTVAISHINSSGFGVCNGSATASVIGNGSGYTCLWSSGQTTSSISGLCAGTYVVTLTDSSGVTGTATVVILEPADSAFIDSTFVISIHATNVSTPGNCDGSASITATGGTPPYSYYWSTGDSTTSILAACSNVYYITVNDSNGQSVSSAVYISEPNDTITNTIPSPPVDTLEVTPIDTCIVDFNIPIDSAFITSFTVVDSVNLTVEWTFWQNGNSSTITTEIQYTNNGFTLLILTLNCSDLSRELHSTTVEDCINIDYPLTTSINNTGFQNAITPTACPNPFHTYTVIDIKKLLFEGKVNFELFDITGNIIMKNENINNDKFILEKNNLPHGVYFFRIYNSKRIAGTGKIIID